jgi:hypothetical protein
MRGKLTVPPVAAGFALLAAHTSLGSLVDFQWGFFVKGECVSPLAYCP